MLNETQPPLRTPTLLARLLELPKTAGNLLHNPFVCMLTTSDLLALMRVCKHLSSYLSANQQISNHIFYQRCFRIDRPIYFDVYAEPQAQQYIRDGQARVLADMEDWTKHANKFRLLRQDLDRSIRRLLLKREQAENNLTVQQISQAIVSDLEVALRQPEFALPRLRRETIGSYCTSSVQVLLAQASWTSKNEGILFQEEEEWLYAELAKGRLGSEQQILGFCEDAQNAKFVKQIRYRLETLAGAQTHHTEQSQTKCQYINVLIGTMKLVQNQLEALSAYLVQMDRGTRAGELSYDMWCEFVLRYKSFRNTISSLEDKLGSHFRHFQKLFQCLYPTYTHYPSFSILRVLLKLWINNMQPLHNKLTDIYAHLLFGELQRTLYQFINTTPTEQNVSGSEEEVDDPKWPYARDSISTTASTTRSLSAFLEHPSFEQNPPTSKAHTDILSLETKCVFWKSKHLAEFPKHRAHPLLSSDKNVDWLGSSNIELFLKQFTEYTVDVSLNEVSVHWCGSTQQKLSQLYTETEKTILEKYGDYLNKFEGIVSQNLPVARAFVEHSIQFLRGYLKPPTLEKILVAANNYLQQVRDSRKLELFGDSQDFPVEILKNQEASVKQRMQYLCIHGWKALKIKQLTEQNRQISFLNRNRHLTQDLTVQFPMLFDLHIAVDLEVLEQIIETQQPIGGSSGSEQEDDQWDDEPLEQIPRLVHAPVVEVAGSTGSSINFQSQQSEDEDF